MDINNQNVRKSALAGSWYSDDPEELSETVETYINQSPVILVPGEIIGLISPHAGHMYSGPVAGYAYKQVAGRKFDTVVVVSPNHVDPNLSFSSVMTSGSYETPLGKVSIDEIVAKAIVDYDASGAIKASGLGHLRPYDGRIEHSIEIQIPFLQKAIGPFKLVPIVMGDTSKEACERLANALSSTLKGKSVLLVASSDLSHFYSSEEAVEYDKSVGNYIAAFDPEGLLEDSNVAEGRVCGTGPMVTVMMACRMMGASSATVLNMANSGDITGDKSSVVGYLAASIIRQVEAGKSAVTEKVGVEIGLTEKEMTVLKNVVRNTLELVVNGKEVPSYNNFNGKLGENLGAFVTLTKNGELRGCIGHIVGQSPLITTIAHMTKAAALDDPRFPPVKPSELSDIKFEISVLTPIREVKDIEEIVVGRDGIIITQGNNRGLLLPQVATEYGWDRITFLEQTCRKAGLPANAWKDDTTTIEMFSAHVFE